MVVPSSTERVPQGVPVSTQLTCPPPARLTTACPLIRANEPAEEAGLDHCCPESSRPNVGRVRRGWRVGEELGEGLPVHHIGTVDVAPGVLGRRLRPGVDGVTGVPLGHLVGPHDDLRIGHHLLGDRIHDLHVQRAGQVVVGHHSGRRVQPTAVRLPTRSSWRPPRGLLRTVADQLRPQITVGRGRHGQPAPGVEHRFDVAPVTQLQSPVDRQERPEQRGRHDPRRRQADITDHGPVRVGRVLELVVGQQLGRWGLLHRVLHRPHVTGRRVDQRARRPTGWTAAGGQASSSGS